MNLFHAERLRIFRALAEGARSGLGAAAALRALGPSSAEGKALLSAVDAGVPFGEALRRSGFPPWQTELVAAAEAAGRLDEAFSGLADELERRRAFWLAIVPKLLYPALLLHLAPVLMLAAASISGGTPMLPALIRFFVPLWGGAAALVWLLRALPPRALGRLPLVSGFARTRLFSALGLLVRAGVSFPKALVLAAGAAGLPETDAALRRAEAAASSGKPLAEALSALELCSRSEIDALRSAELAGRCDEQFALLSRMSSQRNAAVLDSLVAALPPLTYLAVALWIASRIIDSYKGLFGSPAGGF